MSWFGKYFNRTNTDIKIFQPETVKEPSIQEIYKEILSVYKDDTFGKITKSSPDIASKCLEPWYSEYKTGEWMRTERNAEKKHTGFSIAPLSSCVRLMGYGDTYTEFDLSEERLKELTDKADIKLIGNVWGEINLTEVFVKRQMSLSDINTQMYLIKNASICDLTNTVVSLYSPLLSPINHFEGLGFNDAAKLWHNIFDAIQREDVRDVAFKLKDNPYKFMDHDKILETILR